MALKQLTQIVSFISLSSLLLTTAALPGKGSYLIAKRTIPEALYNDIVLFEQYAAAAYCSNNNDSPHTKISCAQNGVNNCPLVEHSDTHSIGEFADSQGTDVTGFVAYDHVRQLVIVSFRGSRSFRNFIADIDYTTNSTDLCEGCEAHGGFWQAWLEARDGILDAAQQAKELHPEYKLVVTGHSLGGALATLCAAELRKMGYKAAMYTYGSPRVGNAKLADLVTNQPGGNYRVTHTNDPVPHLPLMAMGFQHISPEYYISAGSSKTAAITAVNLLRGSEDWSGNTGQLFTNIGSHLWYFNSITACGAGIEY